MLLPAAEHMARIPSVDRMKELVKRLVYNHRRMIILANQRQLQKGKRPDGTTITPEYAKLTIALKQQAGQPSDRVTLKDTGDYYRAMRVSLNPDEFTVEDDDIKAEDLADKYGEVLGADPDSVEQLRKVIRPELRDDVRKSIQQA